ncbi:DNA-processing protein DprA [Nocardia sp. NPDC050799]|uniref:DNA-processing protein DprA n=1 Tax=Nocardia sp. NPDC050799 TaxID=3154842 RepID=UPI0033FEC594
MSTTLAPPTVPDPRRQLAWTVAARAALTDPGTVHALLAARDVEETAADLISGAAGGFPSNLRDHATEDLNRAHRCGARLLTPEDEQWPRHEFDALDAPGSGTVSPVALWVRGAGRLDLFGQYRIAVIGARAATDYGVRVAADFAGTFASAGWTVTAGGAFGVDAAAHHAALVRQASTIAVLATGVDRAYPSAHTGLFDRIREQGLLVSEYPPGSPTAKSQFLQRNRLVVCFLGLPGLCIAEVIAYAQIKAGARAPYRVRQVSRKSVDQRVLRRVISSRLASRAASSSSSRSARSLRSSMLICSSSVMRRWRVSTSVGAPSPDVRQTASPSVSERRRSRALMV